MIGGIDQQAIVAERLQNGCGLRRRLGRQLADRGLRLRKFVVEKLRQRVVDGVGASSGCDHEQRETSARTRGEHARRRKTASATVLAAAVIIGREAFVLAS